METHLFRIERSKIVNNGLSPSLNKIYPGAIFLNASNQVFQIFNNYLAKNRNGTLYSTIQNDESAPNQPISQLHANTIESNKGGTVFLEGISGAYLTVKVTDNYFSVNLAMDLDHYVHSICNISNLVAHLRGNFFYNNSGQYVLEYSFPVTYVTGLTFLNNTLFRNHGLGVNYGATILCNGRAEMHGNVIENPRNHYQISTTWQAGSIIVNATLNWWGEGVLTLIAPLIMDSTKDNKLSLKVIFQPFIQLQPQRVLSSKFRSGFVNFFCCPTDITSMAVRQLDYPLKLHGMRCRNSLGGPFKGVGGVGVGEGSIYCSNITINMTANQQLTII